MAHADDISATRNLQNLRRWWNVLRKIGPEFVYYPEPTNTWLEDKSRASEKFESEDNLTSDIPLSD